MLKHWSNSWHLCFSHIPYPIHQEILHTLPSKYPKSKNFQNLVWAINISIRGTGLGTYVVAQFPSLPSYILKAAMRVILLKFKSGQHPYNGLQSPSWSGPFKSLTCLLWLFLSPLGQSFRHFIFKTQQTFSHLKCFILVSSAVNTLHWEYLNVYLTSFQIST